MGQSSTILFSRAICYNLDSTMDRNSFQNLSNYISSHQIGLGWLSSISVLETNKAVRTDWHRHSTAEMLMCLRGEIKYEFRNHPSITLCAGSYLIVPHDIEHRVSHAIDEPGKRIGFSLRRESDKNRKFAVFTSCDYSRFRKQLEDHALRAHLCPPEMRHALSNLERIVGMRRITSVEYGYLRILCCTILYEAILPPAPKPSHRSKIIEEAVNWLESHFGEDVSMDRLVAFMGYSRARFFALFREHTGSSPNEYLQRIRMRRAMEMLRQSSATAGEIASACGYADKGYFSRAFKRQTGYTPLGYRAMNQSGIQSTRR